PPRTSHHGTGSVRLVPAVRSQSADVRSQHFLRSNAGLSESNTTDLSRARQRQLHRIADRLRGAVTLREPVFPQPLKASSAERGNPRSWQALFDAMHKKGIDRIQFALAGMKHETQSFREPPGI